MIRATTPSGCRTVTFIRSGPIGIDAPFISVTSPAKKSICEDRDVRVAHHRPHRVAAIDRVECRELARVLAHDRREASQRLGALLRRHVAPGRKCLPRALDGGIDVGRPGVRGMTERRTGAGTRQIVVLPGERPMPRASVVEIAMRGQNRRRARLGRRRGRGANDWCVVRHGVRPCGFRATPDEKAPRPPPRATRCPARDDA